MLITVFFNVLKTCAHPSTVEPPKFSSPIQKKPNENLAFKHPTLFPKRGISFSMRSICVSQQRLTGQTISKSDYTGL